MNKREAMIDLCREVRVKRLRLFGSALKETFNPADSDIDFLVEFYNDQAAGISDRFLRLAEGLESLFQRPVDLLTIRSLKNPVLKQIVESDGQTVYEA